MKTYYSQEQVRKGFKYLHNEMGVPYSFIARGCGFTPQGIILFINGDRQASQRTFEDILQFYRDMLEKGANIQ